MTPLWRGRPPPAEAAPDRSAVQPAGPAQSTHPAPGLAVVISRLSACPQWRVLDLGPAVADNVALLGPLAAQLWVIDCLRHGGGSAALGALRVASGEPFDVVLAWEVLDHVEAGVAEALVRELAGCCRPGALLHAVVSSSQSASAQPGRCRIAGPDRIACGPAPGGARIRPPLTPAEFEKRLTGFRVEHVVVLRHGVREVVAVRRPASAV